MADFTVYVYNQWNLYDYILDPSNILSSIVLTNKDSRAQWNNTADDGVWI